jgi:glycosyltransferase involved in cell wall biosynthesis
MNKVYKVGDMRNGSEVLPKDKRKKILLLSDDLRMGSGVATMSKELVMGWLHRFNTYQVGGAVKHPEKGKLFDVSESAKTATGVEDASVRILPWDGYGNADLLRQLLTIEQPDAIVHFTDPRYWQWLYAIEHEVRQVCPIIYYTIWDDVGSPPDFELDPLYNRSYYESCDSLACISKQTYGMVKRLTSLTDESTWKPHQDWQVKYVPHGINSEVYKPVEVPIEFRKSILGDTEYDFVLFWSNRNIRRKQPSDVIYSYKLFCESIGEEKAKRTCLVMHTQPIDENGTDLYEVVKRLNPIGNVIFSTARQPVENLNYLYNLADCTINIAGNEGFGLTTAESVMSGTPIIVNVTGGLQDQCGFKLNGKYLTHDDYTQIGTLHNWRKWEGKVENGEWAFPIWSRAQTIAGSVPTPYIWDDKVDVVEVGKQILEVYELGRVELKRRGLVGREAFINEMGLSSDNMNTQMVHTIETTLENWKPKQKWELFKIN